MENCLFCKIAKGEIPCNKLYEDNDIMAFLDIRPTTKGHTLIIPKKHEETLLETKPELLAKMLPIIQQIAKVEKEIFAAKGFNIGINIGKEAGQEVNHTHIHLIPRYGNDGLHHWPRQDASADELAIVAEKIITKLD